VSKPTQQELKRKKISQRIVDRMFSPPSDRDGRGWSRPELQEIIECELRKWFIAKGASR
jgi:hypothetical protein